MYYNKNRRQTIYYPNVKHYANNQTSFYSNSMQDKISELENLYSLLNERQNIHYYEFNEKTTNLHSCYMQQFALQKKVNGQLSKYIVKHENLEKEIENKLDRQEKVNMKVDEQLHRQEEVNMKVNEQLQEHEIVIRKELQPFINNIQVILNNPIANLLKDLSPGTLIEKIIVQGIELESKTFIDYNLFTNISTFLLKNNEILSVNTNRIDSLNFG